MFTVNVTRSNSGLNHIRLMRGTTAIAIADAAGNRLQDTVQSWHTGDVPYNLALWDHTMNFLDSPSTTSATTYKLQGTLGSTYSGTYFINRSADDANFDYGPRTVSTITVMEVAA